MIHWVRASIQADVTVADIYGGDVALPEGEKFVRFGFVKAGEWYLSPNPRGAYRCVKKGPRYPCIVLAARERI